MVIIMRLQISQRMVRENSDGDMLSDKSASSSTGSMQMSADISAASTDSVAAPSEMQSSSSCGVMKITDIPLPHNRPHTISSGAYQPPMRPHIIPDTFERPPSTTAAAGPGKVADAYSRPVQVTTCDARNAVPRAVAIPTVPAAANSGSRDNCIHVASGSSQSFPESSQHSCAEPSLLQQRKTVSSTTDVIFTTPCSVIFLSCEIYSSQQV